LTATSAVSTCTGSGTGVTGSTALVGGTLFTDNGIDANNDGDFLDVGEHAPVSVTLPATPAVNTSFPGHLHVNSTTETFEYVLNEQVTKADGSLVVNAIHERIIGPTAVGALIIGQVTCGVTTTTTTTTTTTPGATTTTAAGGTTTTAAGGTTTTAAGGTTTTAAGGTTTTAAAGLAGGTTTTAAGATTTTTAGAAGTVGGGAFGFFTSVGLFGGAPATRGPLPKVTLPAAGSTTPITDTAATGDARYGPGIIFTSGPITVSTQGTPGPTGSVVSSTSVKTLNTSQAEVINATEMTSTCKASESGGVSGSATITGGKLRTSAGNPAVEGDETYVVVPANPAPNTSFDGKLEDVGDTFKYIFNEQIKQPDGSITVNAAHQILLGPTAVGELIIGQSRCATTASAFATPGQGVGGTTATTATPATGPAGGLARTGGNVGWQVTLGLVLVTGGLIVPRRRRRRLRTGVDER